jgi:hypothetical protein
MSYDPLSQTTRKVRTSLLIFTSAALSVALFDISPRALPILGEDVPVAELFLPFVLGVGSVFLSVSFIVYAYDDIVRRETKSKLRARKLHLEGRADALVNHIISLKPSPLSSTSKIQEALGLGDKTGSHLAALYRTLVDVQEECADIEEKIDSYHFDFFSWVRFYVVDLGIPVVMAILVVLGWSDQLSWLRNLIGLPPAL